MKLDYFIRKQEVLFAKIDTNYIRTQYFDILKSNEKLIGIIGSRGAGKTTLLLQYLKTLTQKVLYMSGDDIEFTNSRIYDIVDEFYALGGRTIAIDEVHQYKNWAMEIKNIYDSFPDLTIRLSGSSMLNILYEKYDLSRRLVLHNIDVLSFKEYLELEKKSTFPQYNIKEILTNASAISKELVFAHEDLYALFKNYLINGAYPFYLEGKENFEQKLFNAMDKIIHEDIPSLNKIDYSHISIFQKLIYFVVTAKKPFSVNMASLSREMGITEPTLYTYMEILDKTGIFKSMKKEAKRISKKPQKLLFSNTNILYSYGKKFATEIDIGTVRETFFVNCFKEIFYSDIGDFTVDRNVFEVGGRNKDFSQIKDVLNSYLAIDIDFTTNDKKIPLWLFGFIKS
jgi:hypothetical protein